MLDANKFMVSFSYAGGNFVITHDNERTWRQFEYVSVSFSIYQSANNRKKLISRDVLFSSVQYIFDSDLYFKRE